MKTRSRNMTIGIWVVSALLATIYLHTGTKKVFPELRASHETTVAHFRAWGYSDDFRLFIGWAEMAGAAGLLVPPIATAAAVGLVPIMVGAAYNHIAHDEGIGAAMLPLTVLAFVLFIAYQRRSDFLQLGKYAWRSSDGRTTAPVS